MFIKLNLKRTIADRVESSGLVFIAVGHVYSVWSDKGDTLLNTTNERFCVVESVPEVMEKIAEAEKRAEAPSIEWTRTINAGRRSCE